MKRLVLPLISLILLSNIASLNAQNDVRLEIVHALGTSPFALYEAASTPSGVAFDVKRLEYYISEITLIHDGGQEIVVPNVWALVNASQDTVIELGTQNVTEMEGLRFSIGVDPDHNNLDPSTYDPSHPLAHKNPSMHWGWTAGYRFVAMEGNGGEQLNQLFEIHALGNKNYFEVDLPISVSAENGEVLPVIYGNYSNALTGIDVSAGVITHGENDEAEDILLNFRDLVFTTTSPIDTTSTEEPSGISEATSKLDFQIFPNPTLDGNATLVVQSASSLEINVYDLTGKQVISQTVGSSKHILMLSQLEAGVYFVRVNDLNTNEVMVKKLSVQ